MVLVREHNVYKVAPVRICNGQEQESRVCNEQVTLQIKDFFNCNPTKSPKGKDFGEGKKTH
jgi:hypothetical protein